MAHQWANGGHSQLSVLPPARGLPLTVLIGHP